MRASRPAVVVAGVQARRERRERSGGQALIEFSLALVPFVFLVMGVFDLGRGIYTNNAAAQASREIARVVAVHQCTGPCTTGTFSAEARDVIRTQQNLTPGLTASGITVECTTISDTPRTIPPGSMCPPGEFIRVTVSMSFGVVTPMLPVPNPFPLQAVAHVQVP